MKIGKLLGTGNTADIYEIEDAKVIKLFKKNYPPKSVELEFNNAKELKLFKFSKPIVYEIIEYENRLGIIYDRIKGTSLFSYVLETEDTITCAKLMVKLHQKILKCKISEDNKNIMNYKDFLYKNMILSKRSHDEVSKILKNIPEANTLCHGDFHPGNIFIDNEEEIVIDFMNICKGPYLYDVARTVYLIEYTPIPDESDDFEKMVMLKSKLGSQYLKELGLQRGDIEKYLYVIKLARFGECPEEFV
ncbi:MAG: phosphotransferase [bacterium]|nr:phosphotransferase [bacterium]